MRLVTADDLCLAAGQVLSTGLPPLIEALGLDVDTADGRRFKVPAKWDQVPTLEALTSAQMPAGAITSRGIIGEPRRSSLGVDATWRVIVGVFDRGGDYNQTASRTRTWAALVRGVLLANPTLDGVASGVGWAAESYRQFPQVSAARTLGGCAVEVNVTARNVADLGDATQLVQTVHPSIDVA